MTEVAIRRLDDGLPLPSYARLGDAGADLLAREPVVIDAAGGRAIVPTGIAIALPDGYAALVVPRSGLAARYGISCLNTPGLIDSGYRGEIKVVLINTDPREAYAVARGDRIAQLVVVRVDQARFVAVAELPDSPRGDGGFGHTGR